MATIKLQPSGKVVIKDGKVACSCCEAGECCPYPSQALVDGLYTVDDLPDQIQVGPYTLQKGVAIAIFPVQVAGAFYGTLEDEEAYVHLDNEAWNFGPAVGSASQQCLIDGNIVTDQFADSYTITPNVGDSASPTVVTRISLCVWRGTDTCGNFVYLSYGLNPDGGQDIMWNVFFRFYTPTCVIDGRVDGQKNEDEFENTPVGTYSGTFEDSAFVS